MGDITFIPGGPLVECVDISIAMETIIEIMEMFSFAISPNQADRAVNIVEPSAANITITDQLDGNIIIVGAYGHNSSSNSSHFRVLCILRA